MTGYKVFADALVLLGYEQFDEGLRSKAVTVINLVYNDVKRMEGNTNIKVIESFNDDLEISSKAVPVLLAGVAAYLAESEGDDNKQSIWMTEYQRRRTTLSQIGEFKDVLPIPEC